MLGKSILSILIVVTFQTFAYFLKLMCYLQKESNFNVTICNPGITKSGIWKYLFYFIFPDVPLHFHFETLLKRTEIKGNLAENKFVDEYIISPSPGMSHLQFLYFICLFMSLYLLFLHSKEIKFNKRINENP